MKKLLLAACLVVALYAAPAHATTLQVTGGHLLMWQLGAFDTCGDISGPGFPQIITCSNVPQLFPPLDGTTLTQFYVPFATIDGIQYKGPPLGSPPIEPINLTMLFVHEPVPGLGAVTGPIDTPFTMTGVLSVFHPDTMAPVTFDLVGQGILHCCFRPDPLSGSPVVAVEFTFTPVPEASSMLLLAGAIGPLLLGVLRKT